MRAGITNKLGTGPNLTGQPVYLRSTPFGTSGVFEETSVLYAEHIARKRVTIYSCRNATIRSTLIARRAGI